MRWTLAIIGSGIIAAGCGGESTTSSTGTGAGGGSGSTTATSATTGGGGQGGSGGAASTTSASTTSASTTGSTSTSSATSSTGTGMGAIFGATCVIGTDCASGLCANFMQKGMHCSVKCTGPADCPPESSGCGGQGVCKPPG